MADKQETKKEIQEERATKKEPQPPVFLPPDDCLSGEETEECYPEEFEAYKRAMLSLNKEYAVVMLGSDCLVLNDFWDPLEKRWDVRFLSFEAFNKKTLNRKTVNPWRKGSAKKYRSVGPLWLSSGFRRQYDSVEFDPSNTVDPRRYYNMFRGFSLKPSPKGDWSILRSHIHDIVAGRDDGIDHYVMSWMARIIQDPAGIRYKRPGTSLVFRGIQGCGKGCVVRSLGKIIGSHYRHILHLAHLTGRFNVHLKDALLIFCDEITWGGDKTTEGILKGLITEPTIRVEPKKKDSIEIRSHVNVAIASNNDWVIPAGLEERRFCVLDVLPNKAGPENRGYFNEMFRQLESGGYERMMYDLLNYDISSIDLRTIPRTQGLFDQILNTLSPVHKFWFQRLCDGTLLVNENTWPDEIACYSLYNAFLDFCVEIGLRGYRPFISQFGKKLKEVCPLMIRNRRRLAEGDREYYYNFPNLENCRKLFEDSIRISVDWEDC